MEEDLILNDSYIDNDNYINDAMDVCNNYKENLDELQNGKDIDGIYDITDVYLKEVECIPLLTAKEEMDLFYRFFNGDIYAKKRLIEANLHVVVRTVKKMMISGLSFLDLDLIEEGNIALINAIETFDINGDLRFYVYAQLLIYRHVCNVVDNQVKNIRLFNVSYSDILKCKNAQKKLSKKLGYKPSIEQISEELGLSVDKIELLLNWQIDPISIEVVLDEETGVFIDNTSLEDSVINEVDFLTVKNMFNILNEEEVTFLTLRFGLEDGRERSLETVGNYFNMTREWARSNQSRILRKIRREFKKQKLKRLINYESKEYEKKFPKKGIVEKKSVKRFVYKGKNFENSN